MTWVLVRSSAAGCPAVGCPVCAPPGWCWPRSCRTSWRGPSTRDRLAALLAVSPVDDQGAWQQHGALLAAIDRLRVELEAAVRPGVELWRPAPLTERPRAAVRRVVTPRRRR